MGPNLTYSADLGDWALGSGWTSKPDAFIGVVENPILKAAAPRRYELTFSARILNGSPAGAAEGYFRAACQQFYEGRQFAVTEVKQLAGAEYRAVIVVS